MEHDPRGFFPPGDLRVSDAERDLAVSELSSAFQVGRLTAEEFGERSEQAYAARTGKELTALLADLPVEEAPAETAVAQRSDFDPATRPRVAVGATVGAVCFGLIALGNAFTRGPTLQQRELAQQIFRQHGVSSRCRRPRDSTGPGRSPRRSSRSCSLCWSSSCARLSQPLAHLDP